MTTIPFQPVMVFEPNADAQALSVSASSNNAALTNTSRNYMAFNDGTNKVYFDFSTDSTKTSTVAAARYQLAAGAKEVISVPDGMTRVSYISDTSTTTLRLTPGIGA